LTAGLGAGNALPAIDDAPGGAKSAPPVINHKEKKTMSNAITITGNLTREPEIRYTKEGQATAQLGVAVNRRWQDRTTQEWQEATSFFDVVCWRDLAENVALSLSKGMRVIVTGRLDQRSWETDEGEHRSKVEITADEIGPSLLFATTDVQRTARRQEVSEPESEILS
jgi:single-strand DNA-binding protein